MKLIKTANKTKLKLSKKEWQDIGKKAGWIKIADSIDNVWKKNDQGEIYPDEQYYYECDDCMCTFLSNIKDLSPCLCRQCNQDNSIKEAKKKEMKEEDPCWDGYEMVGKKKKDGKEVPNCVPKKKKADCGCDKLQKEAAEYQGKKVTLNKPFRTPGGPKKFSVYVKNDKGNVVKVNFGDPNMEIKRDDSERRKSFRARHNCDNPGPKWKARYWSCKMWSSKNVSDLT